MSPYEFVLSCYLAWSKDLKISFREIDEMDFELLLELVNVQSKINDALYSAGKTCYIDDIL